MKTTAYFLARLIIGTSMFAHGLVRLPKLAAFSDWMMGVFSKTMMPDLLVKPFSFILPVAEFVIGILLLAGFLTRQALIAGAIIMIALIFGSCLAEQWEWATFQMFYGLFFCLLLAQPEHNKYSIDYLIRK